MSSLFKNKIISLFKNPDVLIHDPIKRSRVLVLSGLFLLTFLPAMFLLQLYDSIYHRPPEIKEVVFGLILSFCATLWFMTKKLKISFSQIILNKINRYQLVHELAAILVFLIYLILFFIAGGVLIGLIGFIVLLFQ